MANQKGKTGKVVLVTGAAGTIGRPVCRELARRGHRVRAFDQASADIEAEWVVGDLADQQALRQAVAGAEVVIHLAATPSDADFFEKLLPNNIIGTFNLFQAVVDAGVKRLVVTSSVQAVGNLTSPGKTVLVEEGTAPTNHYAVSKVFAEQLGYMYAHVHDMSVLVVRPGWVPRELPKVLPKTVSIYLSPRDAGRFYAACVEAEKLTAPGFEILFALSRCKGRPPYDMEPARRVIGYEPRDIWPEGLEETIPRTLNPPS
jgi:uronate dehydrogenase